MISFMCGFYNTTQMNLSAKQRLTDIDDVLVTAKGRGREGLGVWDSQRDKKYCIQDE